MINIDRPLKENIEIESVHESPSDDEESRLVTFEDKDLFIQNEVEIIVPFNGLQFDLKESRADPKGNKESLDLNKSLI